MMYMYVCEYVCMYDICIHVCMYAFHLGFCIANVYVFVYLLETDMGREMCDVCYV